MKNLAVILMIFLFSCSSKPRQSPVKTPPPFHPELKYDLALFNGSASGEFVCEVVSNTVAENCYDTRHKNHIDVISFGAATAEMSHRNLK